MAAVLMLNKIQIGFRTCCPYFHPFKWSLPYSWLHVVSSYQDFINNKQSKRKHKLWKQVSLSLSVTSLHLRSRNVFSGIFFYSKKTPQNPFGNHLKSFTQYFITTDIYQQSSVFLYLQVALNVLQVHTDISLFK